MILREGHNPFLRGKKGGKGGRMGGHEISISVRDVKSVEMFSLAVKLRVIGIDH